MQEKPCQIPRIHITANRAFLHKLMPFCKTLGQEVITAENQKKTLPVICTKNENFGLRA
jgi:hypothetical protein